MQFKKTMHILHLILTILFWPWLIIWIWRTVANSQANQEMLFKKQMQEK